MSVTSPKPAAPRRVASKLLHVVAACAVAFSPTLLPAQDAAPTTKPKDRGQGLALLPPERLRSIPMATMPFSGELPKKVDLSDDCPPPGDQGPTNACVGFAVGYVLKTYQERMESRHDLVVRGVTQRQYVFSPAFIYTQVNGGRDGGCYLPDALNILQERGCLPWADFPFYVNDVQTKPSAELATKAKQYRIDYWRQVNPASPTEVKSQLNAGLPIVIGATVDEGFKKASGKDYVWKETIGNPLGGHAMAVVGYDDDRGAYKIINSWGTDWGDGGYGWISYDHFAKVVNEAYVAKDAVTLPVNDSSSPGTMIAQNDPARNRPANTTPPADTTTNTNPNPNRPANPDPGPKPPANVPPTWDKNGPAANTPAVQPGTAVTLSVARIEHNIDYPGRPELGKCLRVTGNVTIPPGVGREGRIQVQFFFDTGRARRGGNVKGQNVDGFQDPDGYAITTTKSFNLPPGGVNAEWVVYMPYRAMKLPVGRYLGEKYEPFQSNLLASASLLVDSFGIKDVPDRPFFVKW